MGQAAAGDPKAMERLYGLTAGALHGYLCHLAGEAQEADDVLQSTFLKAWRYRQSYAGGGARGWLFRIARNAWLDHVRRRGMTGGEAEAQLDHATPEAEHGADDIGERVQRVLDRLPPNTREALVLSRVSGLNQAEIAALLDTSPGNVRIRIHRGLSEIRESLKK